MMAHNIDPDYFEIVIECKTRGASGKLRYYMEADFEALMMVPAEKPMPMDTGQVNGLTFRIEDKWKK